MSFPDRPDGSSGALEGVRVVELASEHGALAGKILADLGAEVIVVEPPGGHASRRFGPFLDDVPGAERSLWWWYYNTGKLGVALDLHDTSGSDLLRSLIAASDIVLEGEPPGQLAELGLDFESFEPERPELVWVSITPFGRSSPRSREPITDLTLQADAGPVWSCGYDDHLLPPVRPGGNQGYHTACLWAVEAALVAFYARQTLGFGQHVDVSMTRRMQRHHRGGHLRMARRRCHRGAADLPPRRRAGHPTTGDDVGRRSDRDRRAATACG